MSTAIVYYSMLGNSEMIAEKMAAKLGADVIRIEPDKAYPDKGAKKFLWGYEFMQVKTVKMGMYEDYDKTNEFYISCGFKEFELFPLYWDEANPCQIYVMSLK